MATAARENDSQATSERTGTPERRRFVAPSWLTPAVRVRGFTVIIAAVAAILYLAIVRELPAPPVGLHVPWPLAAVAFFLGETNVVDIHFMRERHSFSLSEVPGVAFLFLLPPTEYVAACVFGTGLALLMDRNQSGVRRAFNLAQFSLAAVVGLIIFHAIATPVAVPGPREWLAAFVAAGVTSALEATLVATAISLSGGATQFRLLPQMLSFSEMVAMANASLATLAVMVLLVDPRSIVLLAVPTAVVFVAYRAYIGEREKHERLELLYESSRLLHYAPELEFGDRRPPRTCPPDVPCRAGGADALPGTVARRGPAQLIGRQRRARDHGPGHGRHGRHAPDADHERGPCVQRPAGTVMDQ